MRNYYSDAVEYLKKQFSGKDVEEEIIAETSGNNPRKFNKKIRSKQKVPLTTDGFDGYNVREEKTPDGKKQLKISHAVVRPLKGSWQKLMSSYMDPDIEYEEEIVQHWRPHNSLSVVDGDTGRPLTAAEVTSKMETQKFFPNYFVNPMQDLDYILYEAILKNTIIGALMNALTKFIVGTGFRPELEKINPSNDPDKDAEEIDENQDIINNLTRIDHQLSYDEDENQIDVHFVDKVAALIDTTNSFNRSALIFSYDKPVSIDEKIIKGIPSSIKFAHPRDLGIIQASPDTWRLQAVQFRHAYYMVPARDMIYLWNPLVSAKYHNSWLYGGSMIAPMIDASRVIRQIIGVDFKAMAEATWSGSVIMVLKPQGKDAAEKEAEADDISSAYVRGGPNVMMANPEDTAFHNVDFNPKVNEFKDLVEALVRYCVACLGLPHSMFYDESQSNRSTMLGKIQLAKETVIDPLRSWTGRSFSDQWYQRWFRLMYKDSDVYKQFRIKTVFDDLDIEQWFDRVEAVNALDERKQLKDDDYGRLAGLKNYPNMVEPNSPTIPGGGGKKIKFGDDKGNQFEIKKSHREM